MHNLDSGARVLKYAWIPTSQRAIKFFVRIFLAMEDVHMASLDLHNVTQFMVHSHLTLPK